MTPDKLRALADALEPMAKAPRFEDFDVPGFCAWLRAAPAGWKLVPVEPTPEMLASTSWPGCAGTDYAHMLAAAPAAPQAEPKRNQPLLDLLAVIHCDGGHHTEAVGIDQSIKDAQAAVCELKRELAMGKREPLSLQHIHKLEEQADQQWRDNEYLAEWSIVFARLIERAHGIGGSDAE